jgi:hypothetical protein
MRIALTGGSCNSHPSGTSPRYLVKKRTGQYFKLCDTVQCSMGSEVFKFKNSGLNFVTALARASRKSSKNDPPERRTFPEPEFTSPATKQWSQGPLAHPSFLTQNNPLHPINKNIPFLKAIIIAQPNPNHPIDNTIENPKQPIKTHLRNPSFLH